MLSGSFSLGVVVGGVALAFLSLARLFSARFDAADEHNKRTLMTLMTTAEAIAWTTRAQRVFVNYRDFFRLVVGPAGERDAKCGGERRRHVAAMENHDDDLVRRRAGLFEALVRLVEQLLQLLQWKP